MVLPLPLAGEGWGEGGLQIYPPHLNPLPQGRGVPKGCTFKKWLTYDGGVGFLDEEQEGMRSDYFINFDWVMG
jgi:hypothetical protein